METNSATATLKEDRVARGRMKYPEDGKISRRVENLYTARGSSLLSMKEPDEEAQAVQNTTPGTELQHNALGNSLWLEKDGM